MRIEAGQYVLQIICLGSSLARYISPVSIELIIIAMIQVKEMQMSISLRWQVAASMLVLCLPAIPVNVAEIRAAVVSNFAAPMERIAARLLKESEHTGDM